MRPVEGLLALNCQVSRLNQRLLERQFLRFDKILERKRRLKHFFSRFVEIYGLESNGLYRAITFDNTDELKNFFNDHGLSIGHTGKRPA